MNDPLVVSRTLRWRWLVEDARTRWRVQCRLWRRQLARTYDWGPR